MFKGFQNNRRSNGFNGFPSLNFQMNNEAYGFSGCTFWLDAAYGTNTQTDLAAVSSWQTRIGGMTFTQATAGNQPRYNSANPLYNNLPVIEAFDNNRRMISNFPINVPTKWTIITVANYNTLNTSNTLISDVSSGNQIGYGGTVGGANGLYFYNNVAFVYTGTTESTSVKIGAFTNTRILVNTIQEATGISASFGAVLERLFYGNNTGNNFLGNIAEIIIYNFEMTETQCQMVSDRLNSKYAIY